MASEILSDHQRAFLAVFREHDPLVRSFYLTGGTALAAFYLRHRYSEDLDFFSEQEVDVLALDVFFRHIMAPLGISKLDFQTSFNRNLFFCSVGSEVLKVEFTYFPFPRIEPGGRQEGIEIDSAVDIAVNKLFAIYQRTQARDFVDLYCLCRELGFQIRDLIAKARAKFDWHIDPLQLGTQFLRHVERTRLLVHLIDAAAVDGRDPVEAFHQLNRELAAYGGGLAQKPQVVVANKLDLPAGPANLQRLGQALGRRVWPISCATGAGLPELVRTLWAELERIPKPPAPVTAGEAG